MVAEWYSCLTARKSTGQVRPICVMVLVRKTQQLPLCVHTTKLRHAPGSHRCDLVHNARPVGDVDLKVYTKTPPWPDSKVCVFLGWVCCSSVWWTRGHYKLWHSIICLDHRILRNIDKICCCHWNVHFHVLTCLACVREWLTFLLSSHTPFGWLHM